MLDHLSRRLRGLVDPWLLLRDAVDRRLCLRKELPLLAAPLGRIDLGRRLPRLGIGRRPAARRGCCSGRR
ncbi:MAG TPA: hypothetical protein VFA75_14275, partial [Nevskia sp.]|nr:hypothetical protein [Nevskia sp.]